MPGRRGPKVRTKRRLTGLPPAFRPLWPYAKRTHTFATAAAAPIRQAVSRRFHGQLPRRAVRTLDEVVALGEGHITIARDAQRIVRAVPAGFPTGHPTFVAERKELVPRVAVAELPRGRVLGPYRAVITAGGTLVGELSPYFGVSSPNQNPVFLEPRVRAPTSVSGRVGVLAARCDVAYFHFLTDVLPRLQILEELDVGVDHLYLPASVPFQQQLIELLAIPNEDIIDADEVRHLQAETLVVPGLPDVDLKAPPWIVSFLRDRLLPPDAHRVPGRRLYITRGDQRGSRIVTNEAEVVRALEPLGFAVLDPGKMTVSKQIAAFAEADWIVAPHGGALTNLAFASAGASVVELFAPDYVQGCYWKISQCVPGLTYRYLVGTGKTPRGSRMTGVDSDIKVEIEALLTLLEGLARDDETARRDALGRSSASR